MIALTALALSGCAASLIGSAAGQPQQQPQPQPQSQDSRSPTQMAADNSISTAVRSKVTADPVLKGLPVYVDTYEGVVVLRGQVHTAEQRAAAERDARAVKNVKSVRNEIAVR